MAWNGSERDKMADEGERRDLHSPPSTSHLNLKALLAGLIVVAGLGAALVLLRRERTAAPERTVRKSGVIKEVAPAVVSPETNVEAVAVKEKPPHREGEIWYDKDGRKMVTMKYKGKVVDMPVQVRTDMVLPKTRIFPHNSENMIANLLRIEPGQGVFGNRTYKGFAKDFLESLKVPIIPTKDDDEWTRQLKRDVNEAKIELKAAYDRGEDIEEMMRNTREEYKKLAAVKRELEAEVNRMIRAKGVTADDVDDITAAANRMLAEKGIAPIKANPIVKKKLEAMKKGTGK